MQPFFDSVAIAVMSGEHVSVYVSKFVRDGGEHYRYLATTVDYKVGDMVVFEQSCSLPMFPMIGPPLGTVAEFYQLTGLIGEGSLLTFVDSDATKWIGILYAAMLYMNWIEYSVVMHELLETIQEFHFILNREGLVDCYYQGFDMPSSDFLVFHCVGIVSARHWFETDAFIKRHLIRKDPVPSTPMGPQPLTPEVLEPWTPEGPEPWTPMDPEPWSPLPPTIAYPEPSS